MAKILETVKAVRYAAHDTTGVLTPFKFSRRAVGEKDVRFKVLYCGICHSDLHCAKKDWGITSYPIVHGDFRANSLLSGDHEMEVPFTGESQVKQKEHSGKQKGGLVTMPFIIANEAFEKVASYGLLPNMILYLMKDYRTGVARGTNIIFFWSAATNFMPVVGAFLSDSYLGRFLTISLGCLFSLLGMFLLWLTTIIPQAKPSCDQSMRTCKSSTPGQYAFLMSAFAFMSIGAGGIRPCSLAFGADQIDNRDNPKNERVLESFFGWYYASASTAILISFTGIVYIQEHLGWRVGFGVPAILMFFSAFLFFIASHMYLKVMVKKSVFTSFVQVIAVAFKNRKLAYPYQSTGVWHYLQDSEFTMPTEKLRFLNKACIIRNPKDITSDGVASDPWSLCTVDQVEGLKALFKVVPLWSSSIMMSINMSQSSFPVLQASSMNRHLTPNFQIPAGSFAFFIIITIMIWIALYDRVIIPTASKLRGKPVHLGVKYRMGIGLVFSCLGMVVSAVVEHVRRRKAIEQGFSDNPHAVIDMSAMWLVPQNCIYGLAEAFNAIGQTEFFYSELPKNMSSIAAALFYLGMAVANLLASVVLSTVDNLTKGEDGESWISSNINKGHFEKYYWLLAIMSSINLLYFLICSWAYGPCVAKTVKDERNTDSKEDVNGASG